MKITRRLKTRVERHDQAEVKLTVSSMDSEAGCNIFARVFDDGRLVIDISRPTGEVEIRIPPGVRVVE